MSKPKSFAELEREYEKKRAELVREHAVRGVLPDTGHEPRVCIHKDSTSVTYEKEGYHNDFNLLEAIEILDNFMPHLQTCEHWKSGCVSVCPPEINSYRSEAGAKLDGTSVIELVFNAGKGFSSHELTAWVKLDRYWIQIHIRLMPPHRFFPSTDFRYDRHGHLNYRKVSPVGIGEDQMRKWGGDSGSEAYRVSYYWADVPNWEAWKSSTNLV